jgi:hypothetical protein
LAAGLLGVGRLSFEGLGVGGWAPEDLVWLFSMGRESTNSTWLALFSRYFFILDIYIHIFVSLCIAVHEMGEILQNTRKSRPSLNDDPSLCATLYTVCGVGELYQRRSTLL